MGDSAVWARRDADERRLKEAVSAYLAAYVSQITARRVWAAVGRCEFKDDETCACHYSEPTDERCQTCDRREPLFRAWLPLLKAEKAALAKLKRLALKESEASR